MQIFFATLPNGNGGKLSSSFFPSIAFPPELRSLAVSQSLKHVEMDDEKVLNRSNARAFTTLRPRSLLTPRKVGTYHFHKLLARFLNQ
jgi:hypothetical protein